MFIQTITLFNHYTQAGTDKWKRTVLKNVFYTSQKGKMTVDSNGVKSREYSATIRIPLRDGYVPFEDFTGTGWTLGLDNLDLIYLGETNQEITESYSISQLKRDNPLEVFTIESVSNNTEHNLPHWRVDAT